jgi:hypothetical protein
MSTTETRNHRPLRSSPVRTRPHGDRGRVVWAATLAILLGVLFTGLTALTVALWSTDPAYVETNPVVDLAFFALGGVLVTGGLASQVARRPPVAGLQQAVLALATLVAAGWLGGRIEPAIGGLVLLLAAIPLVVLHPYRHRLASPGVGGSRALTVLAALAVAPAGLYGFGLLTQARSAGASCFLGQCARGDRYAEAAALAFALVLVALLAANKPPGWLLPAWSAGTSAIVLGASSLLWPAETGAISGGWAVATVAWGGAFVVIACIENRSPRRLARRPAPGRSISYRSELHRRGP